MESRFYVDADIYLNYWKDEMVGLTPASYYAEEFFSRAIEKNWTIIISDLTKKEILKAGVREEDLEEFLEIFRKCGILLEVDVEEIDRERALELRKKRKIHLSDAFHTAVAERLNATIITRNLKHFRLVEDLVNVGRPEDFL